jgi:hypothetical protein
VDVSVGVIAVPQASVTAGVVGGIANAGQFTVDDPLAGTVNVGRLTVIV